MIFAETPPNCTPHALRRSEPATITTVPPRVFPETGDTELMRTRLFRGRVLSLVAFEHLSFRVRGGGRRREVDVRDISFVQADEAWLELS